MTAAVAVRRRRAAAVRCPVLQHGLADPLDLLAAPPAPSTFGLSRAALLAEVRRCAASGWTLAELRTRFAVEELTAGV